MNDVLTFNTTSIVTMDYLICINYHVILICIINYHFKRDAVYVPSYCITITQLINRKAKICTVDC